MKTFLKVIALSTLFTVAGVQAQDYCQGASQCLDTNQTSQVQLSNQHSLAQTYCQGASQCLEINQDTQIKVSSEQALAQYNSLYCNGAAQCKEMGLDLQG
ncbi:hypothetical protein SNR37_003336 [Agarivorans aestuarii]|uniref:Uncharacterized protein n=1 Tax=Agarivorans aestuarii TaxID=1563703 RepID=A0ABU7G4J3_9ALTE|nr:hypothetical protein [Agarivorans aestuarii]MEE1673909.1 hypothetical protein [Agarivorans aestuarii]